MKKLISIVLLLAMCLSMFAGCKQDTPESTNALADAKAYLINMYQTVGKDEVMVLTTDKDVLSVVTIDGVGYNVEWAVSITEGASDAVKIGESSKENHVLLDIPEKPETDILFTATATIKDEAGNTEAASFSYKVAAAASAGLTDEEIVELAYQLENGELMEGNATLTGVITMVKTPWDDSYKNITVVIQIGELTDKRIECYRLQGEGAKELAIGDTITVTGILKNYNGTIEFDAGCNLDKVEKGETVIAPTDPKEIVAAAYALAQGESLPYSATLTGKITTVDTPWDEGYQNISVTIAVEGCEDKPILCYRLKGDGAADLAVGDTITVTGFIVNYNGTIEFTSGCKLDTAVEGGDTTDPANPTDPTEPTKPGTTTKPVTKPNSESGVVDAAYALAEGEALPYEATLTGKVISVDDAYDSEYGNITVTIAVSGRESKPIKCYRLKGDGVDKIAKGDTITVTGTLKNYYGEIEFDFGCKLDKRVSGGGSVVTVETDPAKIMAAAAKLGENEEMSYDVTLSGKVTVVDDAYSSDYGNISVTITVSGANGKTLKCFRMKGDEVAKVAVGDTITVTGRIKNYYGELELVNGTMTKRVSGGGAPITQLTDPLKIVDAAYNLAANTDLGYDVTLTGKVTSIDTAYSADYDNITVTIAVSGRESKPIKCFRMKGDGVKKIVVGDTITVTGRLKNYVAEGSDKGTIEFDAGCKMDKRVSGGVTVPTDPKEIVKAAYALEPGKALPYTATLTGKIISVDDKYSSQYKNITVTIVVDGCDDQPIKCFRLKGDGAESLKVGDTITVTGVIKNYQHSSGDCEIEFDSGCTFTK